MIPRQITRASLVVLLAVLAACDAGRSVALVPGSNEDPSIEQAEVSLGVASFSKNGVTVENLVAAYQDSGNDFPGEFSFSPDYTSLLRIHRGASLIGWSTSTDPDPLGWFYHGKIRGTTAPDSAAIMAGDPVVAVDPSNPSTVYVSSMMVSNRAWNELIKGEIAGDDEDEVSASTISLAINGFCIARSIDAGETFPEVKCIEKAPVSFQVVDLTSVAVDAKGCVWATIADVTQVPFFARLYRSRPAAQDGSCADWSQIEEITPFSGTAQDGSDVTVYENDTFPKVKTDHEGNIHFATFNNNPVDATGLLVIRKFNVQTNVWESVITPSPVCVEGPVFPTGDGNLNRLVLPSGAFVKQAYPYDFAVGLDETGKGEMRIAITTQNKINNKRFILAFARQTDPNGLCSEALGWNEPVAPALALGAQAFQPVVTVRHGGRFGSEWFMAYLTDFDIADPTKDQLRVEARRLAFFKQTVDGKDTFIQIPGLPFYFSSKNSRVCATSGGYWGDYFGLAYHKSVTGNMHLTSAFSSSGFGDQPCKLNAPLHASPLYVESATF